MTPDSSSDFLSLSTGSTSAPDSDNPIAVQVAGLDLIFNLVLVPSRHPTAAALLKAAHLAPGDEFVVLRVAPNGELQDLLPDQSLDLKASADPQFIVARSDRIFRFALGDLQQQWPQAQVQGVTLKRLARKDPLEVLLLLERHDAPPLEIKDRDFVDLSAPGAERFYFVPAERLVEIHVNRKPVQIARGKRTGLEIKETAIRQGIAIKLDFILSLHKPDGGTRVIGDHEKIPIHGGEHFTAVADDDVS